MTDPTRQQTSGDAPAPAGDPRIDALLSEGLEHYFEGRFEHAIHLWTRVMFLDRHHASARAYIERARGALAERQRRAEEALQLAAALVEQGRAREARATLTDVITAIGDDERTAGVRARLERLERVSGAAPRIHAAPVPPRSVWTTVRRWANYRVRFRHVLAALAVVTVAVTVTSPGVRSRLGWAAPAVATPTATSALGVPVLSAGDVALARARALYARGRLTDALGALDRIGPEQPERTDADRLRVEIQRVLLAVADDQTRQGAR